VLADQEGRNLDVFLLRAQIVAQQDRGLLSTKDRRMPPGPGALSKEKMGGRVVRCVSLKTDVLSGLMCSPCHAVSKKKKN